MRMFLASLAFLFAVEASAVAPTFWRVSTSEEFLGGELEGMAVTSRGQLRPGPKVSKIASFTEPFVLSQTSDPSGALYFGTGNEGKVYRLKDQQLKLLYTAPEPEIYAVAFHNGSLYAASSPNGKVYRIDPDKGTAAPFYDPEQAYIWAIAPLADGGLAVATGIEGKLFRVTANGIGKLLYDSPETHLRSMSVAKNGRILLGGSGQGRIYDVSPSGAGRALYDSQFTEISAIHFDESTGEAWASGVTNALPATAPPRTDRKAAPATPAAAPASGQKKEAEPASGGAVDVSFSFDDGSPGSASVAGGASELYRIAPDGYVEVVRKFDREMVYAIAGGSNGSVLLSTGPLGRIYEYKDHEITLMANVPEKQIVSSARRGDALIVTTTNSGAVYQLEKGVDTRSEYRSPIKDAEKFSTFGSYRIEGEKIGSAARMAFRSGNTASPDDTWTPWSPELSANSGKIEAPPARYFQWKLNLERPTPDAQIHSVTTTYVNRNIAPVIESLVVNEPGVVFISSSYPSSPQVLEATNPDEYGIFTSLENPREKNDPGKKLYRKGFRTISWKARDDNGDSLRYLVEFRRAGAASWLRLRRNLEESQINFDTSQLPDGTYEIRLTASDEPDNPDNPQTDQKENVSFIVDNTPPVIKVESGSDALTIRITDALSFVGRVEYSADVEKWNRIQPLDGISDSPDETYRLDKKGAAGRFVVIRAVDAQLNVATQSIQVP